MACRPSSDLYQPVAHLGVALPATAIHPLAISASGCGAPVYGEDLMAADNLAVGAELHL